MSKHHICFDEKIMQAAMIVQLPAILFVSSAWQKAEVVIAAFPQPETLLLSW